MLVLNTVSFTVSTHMHTYTHASKHTGHTHTHTDNALCTQGGGIPSPNNSETGIGTLTCMVSIFKNNFKQSDICTYDNHVWWQLTSKMQSAIVPR